MRPVCLQVDKERLVSLSNFQFKILAHALSFQCVKKVVYSTCSVHEEVQFYGWYVLRVPIETYILQENECVVEKALRRFSASFKLLYALPEWKHRGHNIFPMGKCV